MPHLPTPTPPGATPTPVAPPHDGLRIGQWAGLHPFSAVHHTRTRSHTCTRTHTPHTARAARLQRTTHGRTFTRTRTHLHYAPPTHTRTHRALPHARTCAQRDGCTAPRANTAPRARDAQRRSALRRGLTCLPRRRHAPFPRLPPFRTALPASLPDLRSTAPRMRCLDNVPATGARLCAFFATHTLNAYAARTWTPARAGRRLACAPSRARRILLVPNYQRSTHAGRRICLRLPSPLRANKRLPAWTAVAAPACRPLPFSSPCYNCCAGHTTDGSGSAAPRALLHRACRSSTTRTPWFDHRYTALTAYSHLTAEHVWLHTLYRRAPPLPSVTATYPPPTPRCLCRQPRRALACDDVDMADHKFTLRVRVVLPPRLRAPLYCRCFSCDIRRS